MQGMRRRISTPACIPVQCALYDRLFYCDFFHVVYFKDIALFKVAELL